MILKLNNFGKFKNKSFEISNGITLFYGENESGKTTIFDSLMILFSESKRVSVFFKQMKSRYGNDIDIDFEPKIPEHLKMHPQSYNNLYAIRQSEIIFEMSDSKKDSKDWESEIKKKLFSSDIDIGKMISEITDTMKKQFVEKFKLINKNFNEVFVELFGGGKAELILEDEDNVLECGIDIKAQPTGKKLQNMMLLSGGEKAFTAIALLFAILKINPAPFCILDEIEAALDDVNVYRYAEFLKKFSKDTQFLIITHRKGTMEAADTVYGVTMEESGISKLLSMKLK